MSSTTIIRDRRAIIIWLMLCIQLIVLVVLVGGYTRLSGSGLSITQWKPIHGVMPPLNENDWQEEFAAYQTTPQYKLINKDMSVTGFKAIFWPEYIHRLLGRLVGIVFSLPLLVFALRKSIGRRLLWRMIGIFILGGLQGAIGWIMVKSGLEATPYVSHTKLALHLSIAFTIFALILWTIFDIVGCSNLHKKIDKKKQMMVYSRRHIASYKLWFFLLCVQIIFGAFMAGLHAGLVYNTWPTMNGEFLPSEILPLLKSSNESKPLVVQATNMLQNITFIQFIHRTLAAFLAIGFLFWWHSHREYIRVNQLSRGCILVAFTIFTQFILGVLTLIYHVPLPIALMHHLTALILWSVAIYLLYLLTNCNNNIKYIELVK